MGELALAVRQQGAAAAHLLDQAVADATQGEAAAVLDVAECILGAAIFVRDGREADDGRPRTEHVVEGKGRQIVVALAAARARPGNGPRRHGGEEHLLELLVVDVWGVEVHGADPWGPMPARSVARGSC